MSKTQLMGALGLAMALAIINTKMTFAEEQGVTIVTETVAVESATSVNSDTVSGAAEATAAAADDAAENSLAESTKAASASANRPQELQQAMDAVQKLVDREDGCESKTYPGIKNYLEGLLEKANNGTTSEAEYRELLAALNEGAEGASLLLGVDRKDTAELAIAQDAKLPVSFYVSGEDDAKTPDTGTVSPELLKEYQRQQAAQNNVVRVDGDDAVREDDVETTEGEEAQDEKGKTELEKEQQKVAVPRTNESKANAPMLAIAGASIVIATAGATVLLLRSKKKR